MANYVTVASDKSKIVLLIIWFLCGFGILPVYYWYVGRRMGLLRLITGYYFMIGAISDLIKIITGSFRDNVGAPVRK